MKTSCTNYQNSSFSTWYLQVYCCLSRIWPSFIIFRQFFIQIVWVYIQCESSHCHHHHLPSFIWFLQSGIEFFYKAWFVLQYWLGTIHIDDHLDRWHLCARKMSFCFGTIYIESLQNNWMWILRTYSTVSPLRLLFPTRILLRGDFAVLTKYWICTTMWMQSSCLHCYTSNNDQYASNCIVSQGSFVLISHVNLDYLPTNGLSLSII